MWGHRSRLFALGVAVVVAACDSPAEVVSNPLADLWKVGDHTVDAAGCGPGSAVTGPPYVRVVVSGTADLPVAQLEDCDGTDPCTPAGAPLDVQLAEVIAGGMQGDSFAAVGDATTCTLSATAVSAVIATGLRLEARTRTEVVTGMTCDVAAARTRGATMPCTRLEVITATRPVTTGGGSGY